jgi:hypothetical protein
MPFSAIRPGAHIATVIRPGSYAPGVPLPATVVQILVTESGTITGQVEAVSPTTNSFTVLGQRIEADSTTYFRGAMYANDPHALSDLRIGQHVTVFLRSGRDVLFAQQVYAIAPVPDRHVSLSGTIRRIEGDRWTLTRAVDGIDSFYVIRSTSIAPQARTPRVGDNVYVFARVDGDVVTAEAIEFVQPQCPANPSPNSIINLGGVVIGLTADSITIDNGTAVIRASRDDETLYDGGDPAIGDNVNAKLEKIGERYVARLIEKQNYRVNFVFLGVVTGIGIEGDVWTFESSTSNTNTTPDPYVATRTVKINEKTKIFGEIGVGTRVIVLVEREPDGTMTAINIQKDPRS